MRRRARPVYFALSPGFLLLDLAGVAEPFRYANEYAPGGPPFALHYVAAPDARGRPAVPSSLGPSLAEVEPLPARLAEDAIVVVVGNRSAALREDAPQQRALVAWLRREVRPSHWVLCICSGAVLAGRAGLLDGRACTTHHDLCATLAREQPRASVRENRVFVRDGNLFTSAGITAGIDLALYVLGELLGQQVALEVARTLVLYLRREGDDPQLSPWLAHRNHLHPLVHRVQDAVVQAPERPWSLREMGRLAHVSPRQLTRLFQVHAGVSPAAFVAGIRSTRAKELLRSTELPVERIAEQVGFGSARQFRRTFRAREGTAPSRARAAKTSPARAGQA